MVLRFGQRTIAKKECCASEAGSFRIPSGAYFVELLKHTVLLNNFLLLIAEMSRMPVINGISNTWLLTLYSGEHNFVVLAYLFRSSEKWGHKSVFLFITEHVPFSNGCIYYFAVQRGFTTTASCRTH